MDVKRDNSMSEWFWYAIGAAILYGMHQIFTRMASERIGDGLGGFVVEATAAVSILAYLAYLYLAYLYLAGQWNQSVSSPGVFYSILTGICVGVGTVFFFLLFQKGGPLSAVPMILAGGAALMATVRILVFKEPASWPRLFGIVLSIVGLFLLRS
jgi:transporter family protein